MTDRPHVKGKILSLFLPLSLYLSGSVTLW